MVFFDWDRSNLSPQALNTLSQVVTTFRNAGNANVTATGHTDTTGSPAYNMALSLRRANAVKDELVRQGVPAAAITVVGKGESELLVQTGDGVREPQNRRVEIVVRGAVGLVSNDLAYCRTLSAQYRRLLGGTQADVDAGNALAKCEAGDTATGIAMLTKILTDARVPVPPRA
ncbi:MAG TPA: OmpA family protein [Reyranella sp.]|nr:OmpA family protein [Reyranella sp.]